MKIVQVSFDQPGQAFSDISGQNLAITKSGTFKATPPLTSTTTNSVFIDSSNSLTLVNVPIAKRSHEQEEFSISFYLKAGSSFASQQNILFDSTNGIGFTLKNSDLSIVVSDPSDEVFYARHKLDTISKAVLITGVYSKGILSLLVDGIAQSQIKLPDNFEFKSTSTLSLTTTVTSSFIILDKIEIFNEAVSKVSIMSDKQMNSLYQNPGQVLALDDASYFSFSDRLKPVTTGFAYGSNKSMSTASMVNLKETYENYVVLDDGYSYGYFTDSVFLPTVEDTSHNQIDWFGDSGGIVVGYNTDGSNTYTTVTNHSNIPGFTGGMLYYKVQFLREDVYQESPAFTGLSFVVYDSKNFFSDNTLYYLTTDFNYTVGRESASLIDQSYNNGISTKSGGFAVSAGTARSVEFMFMPTALGQTCLVDCGTSRYSWSAAGAVTKSNIDSIYVNGVNLYSQTSVGSVFVPGVWHHVVITFTADQAEQVFINQSKTGTLLGPDNGFAHMGIYDYDMSAKAIKHYKHLSSKVYEVAMTEAIILGSDSYSGFNVDRVVLSTQ